MFRTQSDKQILWHVFFVLETPRHARWGDRLSQPWNPGISWMEKPSFAENSLFVAMYPLEIYIYTYIYTTIDGYNHQ
jgi:hypothetical protein